MPELSEVQKKMVNEKAPEKKNRMWWRQQTNRPDRHANKQFNWRKLGTHVRTGKPITWHESPVKWAHKHHITPTSEPFPTNHLVHERRVICKSVCWQRSTRMTLSGALSTECAPSTSTRPAPTFAMQSLLPIPIWIQTWPPVNSTRTTKRKRTTWRISLVYKKQLPFSVSKYIHTSTFDWLITLRYNRTDNRIQTQLSHVEEGYYGDWYYFKH